MKRTILLLSALFVLLLLLAGGAGFVAYSKLTRSYWIMEEGWIYIHPGDTSEELLTQCKALGADTDSPWTTLACRLCKLDHSMSVSNGGAYHMREGMSILQAIKKVAHRQEDPVRLTFIGTRTLEELAGRLANEIAADSAQILAAMTDPAFLSECKCDRKNVGSIFLPDTYQVYWSIRPDKLVRRLLAEYRKYWNNNRTALAADMGLTPFQVSTLCSIAEEETTDRDERGVVARLYWNRLQRQMLLQADPTVKFALGDFQLRRILNRHLTVDSPYNTYRYAGLPPGPIRVVEKATIDTFLHSAPHRYLYMCAKEDFSGRHNFAATLSEHNRNAARYHQALRKNGIR